MQETKKKQEVVLALHVVLERNGVRLDKAHIEIVGGDTNATKIDSAKLALYEGVSLDFHH